MSMFEASPRRTSSAALRAGLLATLLAALCAPAGQAKAAGQEAVPQPNAQPVAETATWSIVDSVATISFDTSTLSQLGLQLVDLQPSVSGHALHPLSVVPRTAPSFANNGPIGLRATIAWDGFRGFEGASLRLRGGFRLRGSFGSYDLSSLELRPGTKRPTTLELVDAAGTALFTTDMAQWEFDPLTGQLRYLNADLVILPALAKRLGEERYAGIQIGVLDLDANLRVGRVPPSPPVTSAIPPCGDWSGDVDVGLVDMSSIGQAGIATVNGRSVVVVLPSAELRNLGTANVPWFSQFTNLNTPPWNDQHPFLVWQMSRAKDGVLEPIGRSDLKHAFLTLNTGCTPGACTDSHVLGIGCADVYGTSTNNSPASLAPRGEVSAFTGIWAHCGGIPSHFDTNGDCVKDFSGAGENAFTHGLKAAETDLQVAGAQYYVEAFYIVRNDINIFNSMGYRQVLPAKPGSTWSFPTTGAYATGPAINAWVNPTTPGAGADNKLLDTGEGRVQLAVRVTAISGSPGKFRYAYALQNHDFDRRLKSFHVPFDTTGLTVENMTYADGDGFATNNWTAASDATGVTFTAPSGTTPPAELDYASMISFRFDVNLNAASANATMDVVEAGSPTSLSIQTLAPATGAPAGAGFYTLSAPCRLLDTRLQGGAINSGDVRVVDVVASSCSIPANATALAVNVTSAFPASGGAIAVYASTDPPTTAGTVSFGAHATRANNAIAQISADGKIKVKPTLDGGGATHVLIDVVGYFAP